MAASGNIVEAGISWKAIAAGNKICFNNSTGRANSHSSPADFKKGVRSLYLDNYKPVFFIFDQFEELFIFGDKEEGGNICPYSQIAY